MKVESVSIEEIYPDPANARIHDRRNLDAIAGSLRRWGQQKPIVISEKGVIVAGNGTWTAAKEIGWKRINAIRTKLEGSEAVAYGIADNRTAELAEWDDSVLSKLLESLDGDILESTGFNQEQLDLMLGKLVPGPNLSPEEEWQGMPECKNEDQTSWSRVIVHFANQEDLDDFSERIGQKVLPTALTIWHPEVGRRSEAEFAYMEKEEVK